MFQIDGHVATYLGGSRIGSGRPAPPPGDRRRCLPAASPRCPAPGGTGAAGPSLTTPLGGGGPGLWLAGWPPGLPARQGLPPIEPIQTKVVWLGSWGSCARGRFRRSYRCGAGPMATRCRLTPGHLGKQPYESPGRGFSGSGSPSSEGKAEQASRRSRPAMGRGIPETLGGAGEAPRRAEAPAAGRRDWRRCLVATTALVGGRGSRATLPAGKCVIGAQ